MMAATRSAGYAGVATAMTTMGRDKISLHTEEIIINNSGMCSREREREGEEGEEREREKGRVG